MAGDGEKGRRHRVGAGQPAQQDNSDGQTLLDQVRTNPAMQAAYQRERERRRAQAQDAGSPAADGLMSQPLTPEQEAQAQAEYKVLQQQKAQQHKVREAAVDRLNAAWAATHGYDYSTPEQLKPTF